MRIALINTNRIKPPIAPIGLEYVAEVLNADGHSVDVLDLCWEDDWRGALARFFKGTGYGLVGLTLRNTDDCAFTSRQSFLGDFADIVETVRNHTEGLIVVGGVGFSVMPEEVLRMCGADLGLWGDGDVSLRELVYRIERRLEWRDLSNLVWHDRGLWRRNPTQTVSLESLPPMSRTWVDNQRYFHEGGQCGIETKRGCNGQCIYCVDPLAKGRDVRLRPPKAVAHELRSLVEQGIDHVHICDSEFNLPPDHARQVCEEIIRQDLGDRLRWYAYCSPVPFSTELAGLMSRAGCAGINFGVDSGDGKMLRRLKRAFTPHDIVRAAGSCREAGMAVMLDLLLGSPGETRQSIEATISLMTEAAPDRVGVAVGVRVYAGTALSRVVGQQGLTEGLVGRGEASEPIFFLEPAVAPFAFDLLDELIGDDDRFFFFDPSRPERNYNYNANERLQEAIRKGYRGAYWDILRRYA